MSKSWTDQVERGSPFALRLILWIALNLGRPVARAFLYPITLYFFLTATEQRRASQAYLRRVLGSDPYWWQIVRHIFYFSATILDRVYLLSGRRGYFDIRVHNADILLERVGTQQGCLLLGSHLGSFEVLRSLAVGLNRFPLKVLMYPEHNRTITGILGALNPEVMETVIPLGEIDTLIKVAASLQSGAMVGMLGDRVTGKDRATNCRFLGGDVLFPAGPALLAAATKAPVILFFGLYRGGQRYDIHFELFSEKVELGPGRREKDIQDWTQGYADRLACYVELAPYNWFNFFDYWNEL